MDRHLRNPVRSAPKAVAPILVFFLVIAALTNARADGSMKTIIVLYILCTFIAALVAVIASYLFPIELTLHRPRSRREHLARGVGEVLSTLVMNVVANPVDALVNANYLGILAGACFSAWLCVSPPKPPRKSSPTSLTP